MNQPVQTTVVINPQKSMGVALILTFLFGPLGLLYASVMGGIIMFILSLVVGLLTLGLGFILGWIGSMIWAAIAVNQHNAKTLSLINQPTPSE